MKKTIIILAFILLLTSCGAKQEWVQKTQFNPDLVETKKVKQKLETVWPNAFERVVKSEEYQVIDLRTTWELKQSGIIGKKVMQIDVYEDPDYLKKLESLDPDEKYAIYCRSGGRSGKVLNLMRNKGFKNVIELKWWIWSWTKSGKKFETFDSSKLILDTQSQIEKNTEK